jgi:hypothetical protein
MTDSKAILKFIRNSLWLLPIFIGCYIFAVHGINWYKINDLIGIAQSKGDPAWKLIGDMYHEMSYLYIGLAVIASSKILLLFHTNK